ncbi:MAG: polysaccharide biosynthesis tyrosine autokinase [Sulfurimonas sp.]
MTDKIQQIEEDEIDIKEILFTLYRYKYIIAVFVVISLFISSYIAYFKPDIYQASATVEVGMEKRGFNSGDILSMAMSADTVSMETEIGIIESRFVLKKAAREVDLAHRYYTTRKFKETELYKESPFNVGMLRGYGVSFELYPIDETSYRLVVEDVLGKNGEKWSYEAVHRYGEEVSTEYFHLNIVRLREAQESQYRFVVYDPVKSVSIAQENISVQQTSKYSSLLKISYEDNVALRAREFADALAQSYIRQSIESKTLEAEKKLAFIDEQLKYIANNLKSSAMKLEEFKRSTDTVALSAKAKQAIEKIGEYESKLSMIKMQEEMLSTLYTYLQTGKDMESVSVANLGFADPSLSAMIGKLQDATIKKKLLREDYTEMYPEVVKLSKTISTLKATITSTVKNLKQSTEEKRALLENAIETHRAVLEKLPADERMFGQLQRKFVVNEKIYSYLLEKRSETAMLKATTVSSNRVIDHALYPKEPIKPKRKLIVLVGLILGLILGIAFAMIKEFFDNRIKGEEDLNSRTDFPILGSIPHMEEIKEGEVIVFSSPKSIVSEALRNLRTNLQFLSCGKKNMVIALTSTISGEGKTTLAMNLASIISLSGKRTVILNTDIRKPTLHERFGIELGKGLSSLLAGHADFAEVIQQSGYENLDVITSGPIPPNPSELIQSERMEVLMEKLKEVYDVVILDTPPVGLVTDARILMQHADVNMYLFRSGYSKKEFVGNLNRITELNALSGLCLVLNDLPCGSGSYGYGYGYGYGYYEEDKK